MALQIFRDDRAALLVIVDHEHVDPFERSV